MTAHSHGILRWAGMVMGVVALLPATAARALPGALAVGSPAPPFQVESLQGRPLALEQLRGQVVVLNFWFIACPPCRSEIPKLNRLVDHFDGHPVVFIGFSPDAPPELQAFLSEFPFRYQIVPESTPIAVTYHVTGAPTHILIDRQGRIAEVLYGAVDDPEHELQRRIEELLR